MFNFIKNVAIVAVLFYVLSKIFSSDIKKLKVKNVIKQL